MIHLLTTSRTHPAGLLVAFALTLSLTLSWAFAPYAKGQSAENTFVEGIKALGEGDNLEAIRLFRQAADRGHGEALNLLGIMYHEGRGVVSDSKKSFELFSEAAEQGNPAAQDNLATSYYLGYGVRTKDKKAAQWYIKSAEQGYAPAQLRIARRYRNGFDVKKNNKKASELYLQLAEKGYSKAQVIVGDMRRKSGGHLKKDYTQAAEWYRKAAEQENSEALAKLAELYTKGNGVEKNASLAYALYLVADEKGHAVSEKYLKKAREELNAEQITEAKETAEEWRQRIARNQHTKIENVEKSAEETFADAAALLGKGKYEKAKHLFLQAAEQGYADAQKILGDLSYGDLSYISSSYDVPEKWYRKAAEQEHREAQYFLANIIHRRLQETLYNEQYEEYKEMLNAEPPNKWYRKAAEQGHPEAQNSLGASYETKKDYEQAAEWYRKSAEQGDAYALRNLADLYIKGKGVEKNTSLAYALYLIAAKEGKKDATKKAKKAKGKLNKKQIEEAENLTQEWEQRIEANRKR